MKKLLLCMLLSGTLACASVPVQYLQVAQQTAHQAIVVERGICRPGVAFATPMPTCTQAELTTAHLAFDNGMLKALKSLQNAAVVLGVWKVGDGIPTSVAEALMDAQAVIDLAKAAKMDPKAIKAAQDTLRTVSKLIANLGGH